MPDELEKQEEIKLRVHDEGAASKPELKVPDATANAQSVARDLEVGEMIAEKYEISSLIGAGAMGSVYRVQQVFLDQKFALKTINPTSTTSIKLQRFQKEAQAAGRLDHPNIIRTIDFGLIDGTQPYLVMDFAEGQTFDKYLEKIGSVKVQDAIDIFIPIFEAIEYAHRQGVVHRDIKPSNIVLNHGPNGPIPKLFDFGIAKLATEDTDAQTLTKTGEIFGTPLYMSPEQCSGKKVDGRSDIYSLGCVLFEALTSAPPFMGSSYVETLVQHLNQRTPTLKEATMGRTKFSDDIEKIVEKLLAKDPAQRYQTAAAVVEDLKLLKKGQQVFIPDQIAEPRLNKATQLYLFILFGVVLIPLCFLFSQWTREHFGLDSPSGGARPNIQVKTADLTEDKRVDEVLKGMGVERVDKDAYLYKFQGEGAARMRFYEFGDRSIGVFGGKEKYDPEEPYDDMENAISAIKVPDNCSRSFQTDDTILEESTMLSHFEPDDLDVLTIHLSSGNPALTPIHDAVLSAGSHLSSLRKLDLQGPFSIDALKNIKINDLKKLDALVLNKTNVDLKELSKMQVLNQLQLIGISNSKNVMPILKKISGSHNLRILKLQNDNLTDKDISVLKSLTQLEKLDLSGNPAITKNGVQQLSGLKKLKDLKVDPRL